MMMIKYFGLILISISLFFSSCSSSKNLVTLTESTITTSAQCGMCKTSIENKVKGLQGVHSAKLNMTSKELKVKHDPTAISLSEIEMAISSIGYDANNIPANTAVYDKLPLCCKKP
jgi:mercuric ion binding protein